MLDTIVAPATPPGRSAIGLIRATGPESFACLKALARKDEFIPRHATLADLIDTQSGEKIDTCLVHCFPAPHSYTGEDLCEISCHGSPVVTGRLLDCFLRAGARLAEPGEFTLRAFLNGKMDLAQAEAVRDFIEARTGYQARLAREQREGRLSQILQPLKQRLIEVISFLETAVEFVEDDVGEISRAVQADKLVLLCNELNRMEATYRYGKFIHEGFQLAIVGPPNVGKSSLFNALLESERAIVTDIPGTTRDTITESTHIHGIPVRLTDTAGIRFSADPVEQLGMERSHQVAGDADILLVVLDASRAPGSEDTVLLEKLDRQPGFLVWNKIDLVGRSWQSPFHAPAPHSSTLRPLTETRVSALTGSGIPELRLAIRNALAGDALQAEQGIIITNLRHRDCMTRTRAALEEGREALMNGLSEEFALYPIRRALGILGEITGETTVENILDTIFATFCIGK